MNSFSKLWQLISKDQRPSFFLVIFLMIVGMLFETISVGLVVPAIAIMTQADLLIQYPFLQSLVVYLENPSPEKLVIIGMSTLIIVYACKSIFLGFLALKQMKFIHNIQASLSFKLFAGYLRQPYIFHLQRNSAQLINNVITETNLFTHSVLIAGMTMLTEALVMFGILLLLILIEPVGTLLVGIVISFFGFVFSRITRNVLLKWGKARQIHEEMRIQHLQQGLAGVKDVKVLGRETVFLEDYKLHNDGSADIGWKSKTLTQLPRLWLELLAVSGIAVLVLTMINQGKQMENILPTIGLFAAAAFRLMPSVNRILTASQSLRFSSPVIDRLFNELSMLNVTERFEERTSLVSFKDSLNVDSVSFFYPGSDKQIIHNISMNIPCGSIVGFIGGSGAGKSTLVDIILGLLTPSQGSVKIDGVNIQKNLRGWQNKIGYVAQTIFLTDDTLRKNIAFGIPEDNINNDAIINAIRSAKLEQFINSLPKGLDTMVGERGVRLSGGQRQRIGIARALYHKPDILVLDEATSSLDVETEKEIMDAVHALKGDKTIFIVAHRLATVERCDLLFRLDNGEVVAQGKVSEVLNVKS